MLLFKGHLRLSQKEAAVPHNTGFDPISEINISDGQEHLDRDTGLSTFGVKGSGRFDNISDCTMLAVCLRVPGSLTVIKVGKHCVHDRDTAYLRIGFTSNSPLLMQNRHKVNFTRNFDKSIRRKCSSEVVPIVQISWLPLLQWLILPSVVLIMTRRHLLGYRFKD